MVLFITKGLSWVLMTAFGLHWGLTGTEFACNTGALRDAVSIPGSGRFPGGGNDNPCHYSCQDTPMNRGAWGLQSMGSQSWTRLTTQAYDCFFLLNLQESWFAGLTWYFKLLDTSSSLWFPLIIFIYLQIEHLLSFIPLPLFEDAIAFCQNSDHSVGNHFSP